MIETARSSLRFWIYFCKHLLLMLKIQDLLFFTPYFDSERHEPSEGEGLGAPFFKFYHLSTTITATILLRTLQKKKIARFFSFQG